MALFAAAASAASAPTLTAEDARRVDRGETVVHERPVAGFPWPEVITYRRSAASPTAVMAVYADFCAQSFWVPDLVTSRVDPGTLGIAFGAPASVATRLVQTTEALTLRTERLDAPHLTPLIDALNALVTPRTPG